MIAAIAIPWSSQPAPPRGLDPRRRALLVAQQRLLLLILAILVLGLVVEVRIIAIAGERGAPASHQLADALLPARGEITDRNGVTLARTFPSYALWFNPRAMEDGGPPLVRPVPEVAAELLAIFPDLDRATLERQLSSGRPGYIRRSMLPAQRDAVRALGEPALELPPETGRIYPQGSLAAHVLGYVDRNGEGQLGMEQVLNRHLMDEATRGQPVALSIDVRVQAALEDELRRGMLASDAMGAAGVVLDVDTGEVLAMASLPEFDPNNVRPDDQRVSDEQRAAGQVPRVFNRVTNQVLELGSTFKPLTVAAAIDAGVITDPARRWQANRPIMAGRRPISDQRPAGATLNVPQALIASSNIVTAQIAEELGAERLRTYFARLGLGDPAPIELPARGRPQGFAGDWPRAKTLRVGFGYGVTVTPLHLATAYAAMVNGGIWRPATLRRLSRGQVPAGRRVFQPATSARMNQMLRLIALHGSGRKANAPGFRVGGKTGTAEKVVDGTYRRNANISTFAAAFPMDRPRYVVIAMIDEPKGNIRNAFQRTAAWNATPVVGRLVPRIGPLLGVLPEAGRDIDLSDLQPLVGQAG